MKQIADLISREPHIVPDLTFESFWRECPRKIGRKDAEKVYEKLSGGDRIRAIDGMIRHREGNPQWQNQALIPHPATFLRQERWNDDFTLAPRDEVIQGQTESPSNMVWSAMTQMFGNRWVDNYGKEPAKVPVWHSQLERLPIEQITRGLQETRDRGLQHPPSLPQFISFCKASRPLAALRALPRPEVPESVVDEALAQIEDPIIKKYLKKG